MSRRTPASEDFKGFWTEAIIFVTKKEGDVFLFCLPKFEYGRRYLSYSYLVCFDSSFTVLGRGRLFRSISQTEITSVEEELLTRSLLF